MRLRPRIQDWENVLLRQPGAAVSILPYTRFQLVAFFGWCAVLLHFPCTCQHNRSLLLPRPTLETACGSDAFDFRYTAGLWSGCKLAGRHQDEEPSSHTTLRSRSRREQLTLKGWLDMYWRFVMRNDACLPADHMEAMRPMTTAAAAPATAAAAAGTELLLGLAKRLLARSAAPSHARTPAASPNPATLSFASRPLIHPAQEFPDCPRSSVQTKGAFRPREPCN